MKPRSISTLSLVVLLFLATWIPGQATSTQSSQPIIATQTSTALDPMLLAALRSTALDLSQVSPELSAIQLVDGAWEGEPEQAGADSKPSAQIYRNDAGEEIAALGDLNGDGADELATVLAINTGSSDTSVHLVVLGISDGPELTQLATTDLGDRTKIEQFAIMDGAVVVRTSTVDNKDSICCSSTPVTWRFQLTDGQLQTVAEGDMGETTGDEPMAGSEDEQPSYEGIIATATTQKGIFTLHQVEDTWYLEIPADLLGRAFYWYSELSQVSAPIGSSGLGLGMIGEKMIAFERVGQRVIVNELSSVAAKRGAPTEDGSLDRAVAESALPIVLLSLPVVTESPEGALVVDLGTPLQGDLNEFSVANLFQMGGGSAEVDPERSFIQRMDAYPNNVGISTLLTLRIAGSEDDYGMAAPPSSQSVLVRHNITLLPETPLMSRYADPRVGYFTLAYEDYSGARNADVETRELITRFRLEKSDPNAEISEPVQPIVFYISREVPERWRNYIKQGVTDWLPAFETAGFKNAILAKDAPSPEEDPAWDPADTRYSLIRWVAQPVANAMGPSTFDPRSGEILSAHVQVFADIIELVEQWYFVQASAVDERARTLPLPDEIIGEALRSVVAHEVGHALGLRHNHRASQAYTIEQLRDSDFTNQHGVGASIMSYGRNNYVAQPGDGVTNLIPDLGDYDIFAIQWGYQPIANAKTPEDEVVTLDQWAARQIDEPWLRFGGEDDAAWIDPTVLTENIGADRIEATRLGLQNLERVMEYLIPATTILGSDFSRLQKGYDTIIEHRFNWLSSVVKLIGGVEENRTLAGRGDVQFQRVAKDRQQAALQFVLENLQTPTVFLPASVLDRLSPTGGMDYLSQTQFQLLSELLDSWRLQRLVEAEQLDTNAYRIVDYLAEVQKGLFAELQAADPQIDPQRRSLQRAYLTILQGQMGPENNSDIRAAARWNLQHLLETLTAVEAASGDATTSAHLADLQNQIETILEGPKQ